ncbi:MAG: DVUA0089 family protein, partial [Anaerolineae bacterium]|nr:DVUA0089 family protein [Anaerolineae bacterium]
MRKKFFVLLFFILLVSIPSVNARQINPTPIAYGQTVTGQSTDFNTMHFYGFSGNAGDPVVITASSPGDSFIQLGDANANLLAENDDISAEVLDSRIEYTLPATGQYLIGITTYRPAEYSLTLSGPGGSTQTGGTGTANSPIPISYGEVISGQSADINTYTFYTFQGNAGDQIVAEVFSDTVDTYLQFGDSNAALLAENDDVEAGNLNSRIEYTLPASGSYLLAVTGYTAGPYQVTVNLASAATTTQNTTQQISSSSINYGASVQGTAVTFTEPVIYDFQGSAGDIVQISAQSDAVDTFVTLFDAAGNTLAENDDISGDNLNSLIETSLPANGTYYVAVTAYRPGPYTLTLSQVLADDGTGTDLVLDQGPIGEVTTGTLDNTTYALEYAVPAVQKGATITIDARATNGDLDTYLALFYGDTLVAENDDRQQGITDAFIEYPNAQPGDYTVVVTRYGFETGKTSGSFEVAINVSGGSVVLPPNNTGATNIPDPSASGYPALNVSARSNWTILAYMGGDNNLEPALLNDLNEFELAGGSTESVRIVAFMDRSDEYDTSNRDWSEVRIFEVGSDVSGDHTFVEVPTLDSLELASLGELDSGYSDNLAQFLAWGMMTYPANHYAVVLNDHGGAWTGIVTDDTSYSILTIPALQDAFRGALQAAGVPKFDLMINDACLMSSIEYYAAMAEFFDYVISSPEITLNPSFDMELLTNTLNSNPNIDLAELGRILIDKYMADMSSLSPDLYPVLGGAVTDLRQFDGVLQAINNFTSVVAANPDAYGSLLGQARSNTYTYSFFLPEDQFGPATNIDVGDFMNEIIKISRDPQLSQAAQGVIDSLASVRLYSTAGGHLKGYSSFYNIYFPSRSADFTFDYFDQSPVLSWAEMLRGYYGVVNPRAVAAPSPGATPAPIMTLTTAPSVTPQVTVTNVYPLVTSTSEPTIVAMEVVGRNIAQVKFTVDQVQPNGESIRLDESNVVIEKIIDGVVDYVNEWESGVNEINFTWEVNLSMVTDGSVNNFEPVLFSVDGTASLAGRYQFPGSQAWQDVTIVFGEDGFTAQMIARDTGGGSALAD